MHFSNPVPFILRLATLIALSSVTTVAFAGQDRIDFDRLSVEQGLSQSIIEQMVQGRKGFMWFATEDVRHRGRPQSLRRLSVHRLQKRARKSQQPE
jgi:ligand-binding sensor domain-containing protein